MKMMYAVVLTTMIASQGSADVRVIFTESAPKDRFTVENTGDCALDDLEVSIDLSASAAGLIFDVTGQGAGVQVFQPLELVSGAENLKNVPDVLDGDNMITLSMRSLAPSATVAFTIDVDDTVGTRATMISGAEIQGAMIRATFRGQTIETEFSTDAVAVAALNGCST
ncbi:MAG: aggregation factor core [Roseobacter sp.]